MFVNIQERLFELQEAVHWAQLLRASRKPDANKSTHRGLLSFFQKLFIRREQVERPMVPHLKYQTATNQVTPGRKGLPRIQDRAGEIEIGTEL